MTLLTLEPSVVAYSERHEPTAHVPSFALPTRGLCGTPIANTPPIGSFIHCARCEWLLQRRRGGQ